MYNYLSMTSTVPVVPDPVPQEIPTEPYVPEKTLLAWRTKSRPFKRRTREYWVTLLAIASLLSFIMFLAEGTMPVVLIVAVFFLYYVLSTVEPHELNFSITNKGVKVEDKLTKWDGLKAFWFAEKMGSQTLNFQTVAFPGIMEIMVFEKDEEKIREILLKYLPEQRPEKSSVDKASEWVSTKILRN